jgi:pimeloyl-ACP methyl ester carboxylesterase
VDRPERRVASSDGVELAVVEAGDPSRPTVVLIHGYPDTKEMWDPVIARLTRRLHVLAYDVRGAGRSDAPRHQAAYDLDRLGDDLLAVTQAGAPGERVHLAGHDWGGLQGWEFATQPRFAGRLRSFTAIAAPSLDQVSLAGRGGWRRRVGWAGEARRSWYIAPLLIPGGPELMWRGVLGGGRWRRQLQRAEGVPVDAGYPAPTLARDAIQGANLYRRNIPRRLLRPRGEARAHVPVQLVVPTRDRYIPTAYYETAERHAPSLRRRMIDGPHWLPRTDPDLVADCLVRFVEEVEAD